MLWSGGKGGKGMEGMSDDGIPVGSVVLGDGSVTQFLATNYIPSVINFLSGRGSQITIRRPFIFF